MRILATAKIENLLTLQDVAAIAGRSYSWVRDRTIDGTFAYVLVGRRVLVPAGSVAAYLRQHPTRRPPRLCLVIDNTK